MIQTDTIHPTDADIRLAKDQYALRTSFAGRERPACRVCGDTVLLIRLAKGLSTCYAHDGFDPFYAEKGKRRERRQLPEHLEGPPARPEEAGRVRGLRKSAGLSISKLAEEIGVSHTTLYRWERGKRALGVRAVRTIEETIRRLEEA